MFMSQEKKDFAGERKSGKNDSKVFNMQVEELVGDSKAPSLTMCVAPVVPLEL